VSSATAICAGSQHASDAITIGALSSYRFGRAAISRAAKFPHRFPTSVTSSTLNVSYLHAEAVTFSANLIEAEFHPRWVAIYFHYSPSQINYV
jgi:hypothetical protein